MIEKRLGCARTIGRVFESSFSRYSPMQKIGGLDIHSIVGWLSRITVTGGTKAPKFAGGFFCMYIAILEGEAPDLKPATASESKNSKWPT